MSDWRIPMGAANLIVRDVTLEEALRRAENWRGVMAFTGELAATEIPAEGVSRG